MKYKKQMPSRKDNAYPELLARVHSALTNKGASQLKVPSINEQHEARNAIQHNGIIPDRSSIWRYYNLTTETLDYLIERVFQRKWNAVSLSSLIRNAKVRQYYQQAEQFYNKENYKEAVFNLFRAFEEARETEQGKIYGSLMLIAMSDAENAAEKVDENTRAIYKYADKINEEVEVLKLRLDYKAYMKYRSLFITTNPFATPYFTQALKEYLSQHRLIDLDKRQPVEEAGFKEIEARFNSDEFVEKRGRELFDETLTLHNEEDLKKWLQFAFVFVLDSILRWEQLER